MKARARFVVPEVVQTSNMDCGPAALKSLLEGFGIHAHYGRLREACQTDVDGTSIDTIEEAANELGLEAEQIVVPADHVLLEEARALPAIAVVVLPTGVTHFVIVWRRHGPFVQLMDPATGRRWVRAARFLSDLYVHRMVVPAEDWRAYAGSEDFLKPLRRRLEALEIHDSGIGAADDPSWHSLAALDAGVRMVESLAAAGAIRRGAEADRVLQEFVADSSAIPEHYWSVRPSEEEGQVVLRGAVLVRALGRRDQEGAERRTPASPELAAALQQPPTRPGRELLRLLRADGAFVPAVVTAALALASGGVIVEAVLLRGLIQARSLGALGVVVALSSGLLLLEIPVTASLLGMGRRLEVRLREAFLRKIPRLGDRYFQSRLKSDLAERSHGIHLIRRLPELAGQMLRYIFEIVFTTAGIIWLDPASAPVALLCALAAVAIPLASQPLLMERDLRFRTHAGALSHFYLDALLGLVAIHTHGGQPAVRREHESRLVEWARAGLSLQRAVISLETVQFLAGFGLAIWLLAAHLGRAGESGAVLLLVYWALNLPALGQEVALIAWQYPSYRNTTLRLLEPLGALEQAVPKAALTDETAGGAGIVFENVSVTAAGHTILRDIQLSIRPGEHVAIVGASGAGKSSLVGLLLGWHRAASGCVLVDGAELDNARIEQLRPHIAWVDPAVQLWNRPLLENLRYGLSDGGRVPLEDVIEAAELRRVLDRLPDGLKTPLGEGGGLVSGGEGQRVRLARALLRPDVRLAILDEPFRGLDFEQRRKLLARAREFWRDATLLWISHDVAETLDLRTCAGGGGRTHRGRWRSARTRGGPVIAASRDARSGARGAGRALVRRRVAPIALGRRRVDGVMSIDIASLLWPASRLGEAVQHLTGVASLVNPPASIQDDSEALADWLETAALTIGLEAQPLESSFADFERLLRSLGPAVLRVPGTDGPKFLAIVKGSTVLTPALDRVRISPRLIRSALCGEREAPAIRQINETLERAQVVRAKQAGAREAILRERFSSMRVRGLWQLRLPPGANFWQQLRQERIPGRLAALTGAHAIQYVLWIAAWYVAGTNVLNGRTGRGWLVLWTLLLLALVPLRVLITWLQGRIAIGAGARLKRRLFFGRSAAGTGQFSSSGRGPITRARAGMPKQWNRWH